MIAGLLYQDKDWKHVKRYEDDNTIIDDLNLKFLFRTCAQTVVWKKGNVEKVLPPDPYIEQTMRQVMMVPLRTAEEVTYRQAVVQDFMKNPEIALSLYDIATKLKTSWELLGRSEKTQKETDSAGEMITRVRTIHLLLNTLCVVKDLLEANKAKFTSLGMQKLMLRIKEELSEEKESRIRKVIDDLSFFVLEEEREAKMKSGRVCVPQIVLGCRIGEGLRFDSYQLEDIQSLDKKYHKPGGFLSKMDDYKNKLAPDAIQLSTNPKFLEQGAYLERMMASYLCEGLAGFVAEIGSFFDQLKMQSAFMVGMYNLEEHMRRYELHMSFPKVGRKQCFKFEELKELIMCLEQHRIPIGNTCEILNKNMLVVTGANQGGKSTFLRSLGIAQIMFQAGMPVLADSYEAPLYPGMFTHFTRREDSEMNSGRLDEELKRMSQIIDFVRANEAEAPGTTLVLLNESFATTTEKEGSVISYDILQAMTEMGVNVATVTHLLSFAKRLYEEKEQEKIDKGIEETNVVFLSAERLDNGERTYKMIPCVPQLTSFGLDLYDQMIHGR